MPDLDFVPLQRTPVAAARFAARPATHAPERPAEPAGVRAVALARLDAPAAGDDGARAAGWAAGYAAGARRAAADAAEQAARTAQQAAHDAQVRAAEHASALAALDAASRALQARTAPVVADALATVRTAALELAVALLGVELGDASSAARAALARVLAEPDVPDDAVVHLHPRDLAALPGTDGLAVTFVADPALAPGDAVLEHADGHVDARIGTAVQRVRDALEAP
ncbi:FliH/SctL family protein [Cellulomonas iranensis]|uniref:FliH/SctL family protein n=1 Tax=Cellulomonas iranensis TaxID=76862 RepID=UPI0015C5D6F0|nr:FliH/SctL family protein [Cellulomonas iranensis]